ncbi:hypothetical protein AMJ86_01850 [bacterium SM23_57]|nr:MAG: hypothetical protein AMJ86_01850 [bacterium SM23_57]
MTTSSPILYLKDTFKEEDWPWIIPALHQDSIIWKALNNLEFLDQAILNLGNHPRNWMPVNLAFLTQGEYEYFRDQKNNSPIVFSDKLKQYSIEAYASHTSENPPDMDLKQAGLLAFYLYEKPENPFSMRWKTSLACLYGITLNPIEYLSRLKPQIAVHVFLCQPLKTEEQKQIFLKLLQQFDIHQSLKFLQELSLQRFDLAVSITQELLDEDPSIIQETHQNDTGQSIKTIEKLTTNAAIHSILNDQDEFIQNIGAAWEETSLLKTDFATQIIISKINHRKINEAADFWYSNRSGLNAEQIARIIINLEKKGDTNKVLDWFDVGNIESLDKENSNPSQLLAHAIILYHQGKDDLVYKKASNALVGYRNSVIKNPSHVHQLALLFTLVNQPAESIQAIKLVLEQQPNNIDTILLLLQLYQKTNNKKLAIQTAHLAVALAPEKIHFRRLLAKTLEQDNQWSLALVEREAIIQHQPESETIDFHRLAYCALKADQPQRTATICQKLLNENTEDSEAHHLLGKAYLSLGDPQKSQTHFIKATQISPTSPKSWLSLASLYDILDQKDRQKEILLAASNVMPNNPEILFALGKEYYKDIAFTQALHSFQNAYQAIEAADLMIEPELQSGIAEYLGKTLQKLGHTNDAIKILEDAYEKDPEHIGVAKNYASSLLSGGFPEKAHTILTKAKNNAPDNLELCLDFAKASILTAKELETAKKCLLDVLKLTPDLHEAKSLLAEVYELTQDYNNALITYQEAIKSQINDDPDWKTRLLCGIGRTSIKLNQPEIAIEMLKKALIAKKDDLEVLKILSTAYQVADSKDKALSVGRRVIDVLPDNEDNMDWFIQQAIALDATDIAIEALKDSLQVNPERPSYFTKLGWLYLYEGDADTAWNTFNSVKMADHIDPQDLYKVSQGFLALNDPSSAVECVDKAISMSINSPDSYEIDKYYFTKATAQQYNGDLSGALGTIEELLSKNPLTPEIIDRKSKILFELNRKEEAIACLENGIELFPENEALTVHTITLYRANGDLASAVKIANSALQLAEKPDSSSLKTLTLTIIADLAESMLQSRYAKEIIEKAVSDDADPKPEDLTYYCKLAKLALDDDEEISAAKAITSALRIDPKHPRVLALQARLTSRQGDFETAKHMLQRALKATGSFPDLNSTGIDLVKLANVSIIEQPASTYLELAEVCLLFQQWSVAIFLLQESINVAPNEPRSYFAYARALVLRAEYQRLCNILDIVINAPGLASIAEYAYHKFETAILKAAHLITEITPKNGNFFPSNVEPKATIANWLARGQVVFQPSLEHAEALSKFPQNPDNQAAYIAALRNCDELNSAIKVSINTYREQGNNITDSLLLGQIALTLSKESPDIANEAIQTAIKVSRWFNSPDLPIYYWIQAEIAQQYNDPALRLQAIQSALEIWPNEPNWLVSAADLLLPETGEKNISQVTHYLEQAAKLEPKQVSHHLKLAEAYSRVNRTQEVIRVLEQATTINPKQPDLWLALAHAYHQNGDVPQAIRCAKTVVQMDPAINDSILLLATIALDVKNPQKAFKYLDDVLEKEPNNSQALLLKSKTYKALNKPKEALISLDKALENISVSIPIRLERINLIREAQGERHAFEALTQLNDIEPNNPHILFALAESHLIKGDHDSAIQTAQEALANGRQEMETADQARILELLGRLLRKSGHLDQAIHHFSEAVELCPDNPKAYIDLGRCYQEQRQYDRGLHYLQNAISLAPEDPMAYYFAGLIFKEIKEYENAEIMFKKAADLAPDNLNIHRQLGAVTAINLIHNRQEEPNFIVETETVNHEKNS